MRDISHTLIQDTIDTAFCHHTNFSLFIFQHVGLWSPTIIRGDDREAIYIPNHKFTMSILRNNTRRSHWRIKTYLAISHMDAGKIGVRTLN
jgi:hypothetical protein